MLDRELIINNRETQMVTFIRDKYDESYIQYTIEIIRKCREHGFRVCKLWWLTARLSTDSQSYRLIKMSFRDLSQDQVLRTGLLKLLV